MRRKINTTKNCYVLFTAWKVPSLSGPYFPAFGVNKGKYSVLLCIQFDGGERLTRKAPNKGTSHAVILSGVQYSAKHLKCQFLGNIVNYWNFKLRNLTRFWFRNNIIFPVKIMSLFWGLFLIYQGSLLHINSI